jgi:hypothetical protein
MEDVVSNKARLDPAATTPGATINGTTGESAAALPGKFSAEPAEASRRPKKPVSAEQDKHTQMSCPEDSSSGQHQQFPLGNTSEGESSQPLKIPGTSNEDQSLANESDPEKPKHSSLRGQLRIAPAWQNSRRKLREAEKAARRREKRAEEAQQQAAAQQISCLQVSQ